MLVSLSARLGLCCRSKPARCICPLPSWSCAKRGCCGHQTAMHMMDARAQFVAYGLYHYCRSCDGIAACTRDAVAACHGTRPLLVCLTSHSLAVHLYPLFTSAEPSRQHPSRRRAAVAQSCCVQELRSCVAAYAMMPKRYQGLGSGRRSPGFDGN